MDYDQAYNQAMRWLKRNPGKDRKVISSADGFQVVDKDRVLVEFRTTDEKKGKKKR